MAEPCSSVDSQPNLAEIDVKDALLLLRIPTLPKGEEIMTVVSRECICNTLQAKRKCRKHLIGFIRQVYSLSVRNLRSDQLTPHVEMKMRAGRYLDMQALKRAAPEIIVIIRDGLVQKVRSTNPYTQVWIADYDIDHEDEAEEQRLNDAEERGNEPDIHVVY